MYEYKAVTAPRRAKRAKGARTPADRFARTLTETINAEAAEGWEYLRADTLPVDEKQGMLGKATEVFQSVLIFRRSAGAQGANVTDLRPLRAEAATVNDPPMNLGPAVRKED
ncbi:MAG: DUF4177 domain-containing protein [Pseudomonadota bacterium]